MSISIGGHELNPNMYWSDRAAWSPVDQTVRRTASGTPIISTGPNILARPITLVALEDQGWVDKTQYDFLQSIANTEGGIYPLVIGAETFSVMFRHHEPPALELQPLISRSVPLEGDYFVGSIKLMSV